MTRPVRPCFLPGADALTGKDYDHRQQWIDDQFFDLLCQAIMWNQCV